MRKFSKVLVVALVLCLLCSAVAMSVFASVAAGTTNTAMLKMTDHKATYTEDFEGSTTYGFSDVSMTTHAVWGKATANGNGYFYIRGKDNPVAFASSSYFNIAGQTAPWNSTDTYTHFVSYVDPETAIPGQEGLKGSQLMAATLDFDFGSDKYAYELNDETLLADSLDAIPADATNVRLALDILPDSPFCTLLRSPVTGADGKGAAGSSTYAWSGFKLVDGKWYITANQDKSGKMIELSNKVNVLDHYTVVMYPVEGSVGRVKMDVYVNGEFLSTTTQGVSTAGREYAFFDEFRVSYTKTNCLVPYSIAMDNFAVNYYPVDYESATGYGLDDFLADTASDKQIINCTDVVYNSDYVQPGAGYVQVDDNPKYYLPAYYPVALEAVKNGSAIVVDGADVSGFIPDSNITAFTVKLLNGATFNLDASVAGNYMAQEVAGVLNYSVATAYDKATIIWHSDTFANGGGTELARTDVALGVAPNVDEAPVVGSFDYATGSILALDKWMWDPDGPTLEEGWGDFYKEFFEIGVLDDTILGAAGLVADDPENVTIDVYPTFKNVGQAAFGVIDAEGKTYLPTGASDYSTFTNLNNVASVLPKLTNGSTLKFYDVAGTKQLTFSKRIAKLDTANQTVTVDFGGLTILNNSSSPFFEVTAENVNFTLCNGTYMQAYLKNTNEIWCDTANLVRMGTVDASVVNFGTPDGEKPINYYGGTVYYTPIYSSASGVGFGEGKMVLNVYGGTIYSSLRLAYTTFAVLAPDVEINIHDAIVYTRSSSPSYYGMFGDYAGAHRCDNQKINCYNSILIAQNETEDSLANLFSTVKYLSAYFENCVIAGSLKAGSEGTSVTLGAGNIVACGSDSSKFTNTSDKVYTIKEDVNYLSSNGYFAYDVKVTYPQELHMNVAASFEVKDVYQEYKYSTPTYNEDGSFKEYTYTKLSNALKDINSDIYKATEQVISLPVSFVTYTGEPTGLVDVNFSSNGTSIDKTVQWFEGYTVIAGPAVNQALNNGWYDLSLSGWVQSSDNESTVVKASDNLFVATEMVPVAVSKLSGIKASAVLYSEFDFFVYVPKPTLTNIEFSGIFVGDANRTMSDKDIDGVIYKSAGMYPAVNTFSDYTFVVKYKVEYEGKFYDLSVNFNAGMMSYIEKIVAQYECGSDELKLAYSMLKYMETASIAIGANITSYTAKINAVYATIEAHTGDCSCVTDIATVETLFSEEEKNTDIGNLSEVVAGASWRLNTAGNSKPKFAIFLKTLTEGQTAKVEASMIDATTGAKMGISFKAPTDAKLNEEDCQLYISGTSIRAYNLKNVISIKVTITENGEDTIYEGTYSLAKYAIENPEVDAAKALWAFSNAAYDYKVLTAEEQK